MHNVLRWVEANALANLGLTELDAIDAVVRNSDDRVLSESVLTSLPNYATHARPRLAAFKELRREWKNMSASQFAEVMTTAHFATYFSDAVNRAFYSDYAVRTGDWRAYIYMDTAPDFRRVSRLRLTQPGPLYRRREKAEAKATNILDSAIDLAVDEYARQFDVSWRVIMDDDLGLIRQTPVRMAQAAAQWLDQFVSNLYDNATTQATLAALGAPWAGTGRLTAANLAIAISDMMTRTDPSGRTMSIGRVHLVIPPILLIQAQTILRDVLVNGGSDSNILSDFIAGVHVDPYIGTSGADIPWYLFAEPSAIPAVTLLRLQGWTGPIVAMKNSDIRLITGDAPAAFTMGSFATGDVEFLVEDVVGGWDDPDYIGVTDYRGIYYSSGTTP